MGQILSSCHFSDDVASMIKPGLSTNGFYPAHVNQVSDFLSFESLYGSLLTSRLGQPFPERFIAGKQLGAGLPGCQGIIVLTELLVLVAQQHVSLRELGLRRLRFLLIDQLRELVDDFLSSVQFRRIM